MCAAYGCSKRPNDKSSTPNGLTIPISFHKFPKDDDLRREWMRNIYRKSFTPSKFSQICSLHFEKSCFKETENRPRLKKNAIPTIFLSLPSNLQASIQRRNANFKKASPKARSTAYADMKRQRIKDRERQREEIEKTRRTIALDHPYTLESPPTLKRKLDICINELENAAKRRKRYHEWNFYMYVICI